VIERLAVSHLKVVAGAVPDHNAEGDVFEKF
jgi:hypothetical protein